MNFCSPLTVVLMHKISAILILWYVYNVQLDSARHSLPEVNTNRVAGYLCCVVVL